MQPALQTQPPRPAGTHGDIGEDAVKHTHVMGTIVGRTPHSAVNVSCATFLQACLIEAAACSFKLQG